MFLWSICCRPNKCLFEYERRWIHHRGRWLLRFHWSLLVVIRNRCTVQSLQAAYWLVLRFWCWWRGYWSSKKGFDLVRVASDLVAVDLLDRNSYLDFRSSSSIAWYQFLTSQGWTQNQSFSPSLHHVIIKVLTIPKYEKLHYSANSKLSTPHVANLRLSS